MMPRLTTLAGLACCHTALVAAFAPCPVLGPAYPQPIDFSSNSSAVASAWKNLTVSLEAAIKKNDDPETFDISAHSFSIGAYSIHDVDAQKDLQFHWTGSLVANSSLGTNKIDENSIYRIASISKLITSYLVLVELGMASWEQPITDFFPELAQTNSTIVPGTAINWKEITVGSLAGQISGVGRDIPYYVTDLAVRYRMANTDPTLTGFPFLNYSDPRQYPSCSVFTNLTCPAPDLFTQAVQRSPTIQTWSQPSYSNIGHILLGFILEKVRGKDYSEILKSGLFDPLGMNSSSAIPPTNWSTGNTVIPGGNATDDWWGNELGIETAAEGIYSSLADLNKLGLSILNSTFLEPVETRRWLKPISHSSNLKLSVGRPWEIFRVAQPVTDRTNDIYTKAGNFQKYASLLALSPDHDAGFTVLVAGPQSYAGVSIIQDMVGQAVIPAFEAQAAAEAKPNFSGEYSSTNPKANSTLAIVSDTSSGPGLIITRWINNGTDMMKTVGSIYAMKDLDARLYPTGVGSEGHATFRAVFADKSATQTTGMFSAIDSCESWETFDAITYGQVGIDEFVFEIGEGGRATSVSPTALRVTLARKA